jgi:hypothetical protein
MAAQADDLLTLRFEAHAVCMLIVEWWQTGPGRP